MATPSRVRSSTRQYGQNSDRSGPRKCSARLGPDCGSCSLLGTGLSSAPYAVGVGRPTGDHNAGLQRNRVLSEPPLTVGRSPPHARRACSCGSPCADRHADNSRRNIGRDLSWAERSWPSRCDDFYSPVVPSIASRAVSALARVFEHMSRIQRRLNFDPVVIGARRQVVEGTSASFGESATSARCRMHSAKFLGVVIGSGVELPVGIVVERRARPWLDIGASEELFLKRSRPQPARGAWSDRQG